MGEVIVESLSGLRNEVRYGAGQTFTTDEPLEFGGEGAGPDPYTLLLAALGSCVSMTVTLYARRKGWKLSRVRVRLRMLHRAKPRSPTSRAIRPPRNSSPPSSPGTSWLTIRRRR